MFKFAMSAVLAAVLGGMVGTTEVKADSKLVAPEVAQVPRPAAVVGEFDNAVDAGTFAAAYKRDHPSSDVTIRKVLGTYYVWAN